MTDEQYVCTVCGFNMVGFLPHHCPFCGAPREKFLTSEECSARHQVEATPVTERVSRLNSIPPLGLEHAAYRLETSGRTYWIDCPSSFDKRLNPPDVITFTHHHFLGASNQYRELWGMEVRIHDLDSQHELCRRFTFDATFKENFHTDGIETFHIDGHTPGFTLYFFRNCLFICDYVLLREDRMVFNPFGPVEETLAGGRRLRKILEARQTPPSWVCGVHYVMPFAPWWEQFTGAPIFGGL
jgi:hydroxyacylglutathione hydrolase